MKKRRSVKSKKGKKKSRSRSKRRYDSKKLQKRLKRSQERAQGSMKSVVDAGAKVTMFRPKDGSHILDIIPYDAGSKDPIVEEGEPTYTLEIWVHPFVGTDNAVYLCLQRMYNKDCPICTHRQKLIDKGVEEDVYKKLFPKCRHLYNVVSYDKGEEKKGVQVWDVSYHYSEKHIIPLSKRPTRGGKERTVNFPDPIDGKSITFTIEPAKTKNDYPSYVGWAFEDREYEIDDDILDAAHTLDEIVKVPKAKEVAEQYKKDKGKSSRGGKKRHKEEEEEPETNEELQELLEEVEDMDEMEELEDFIDEHDLDVKIKRNDDEEDVKEKISDALEDAYDGGEEEEEEEEEEQDYNKKEIRRMKKKVLLRIIDDEELDVDPDDAEDTEELQDMIIEELDL